MAAIVNSRGEVMYPFIYVKETYSYNGDGTVSQIDFFDKEGDVVFYHEIVYSSPGVVQDIILHS